MDSNSLADGDLLAVLRRGTHEELKAIATAIGKAVDVFPTRDRRYRDHSTDLTLVPEVIGEYLCRAGGHSVRNRLRGGGPDYAEVVRNVGTALGIKPLPDGVVAREEAILRTLMDRAMKKLSPADKDQLLQAIRQKARKELGWPDVLKGGVTVAAFGPLIFDTLVGIVARVSLPAAGEALGLRVGAAALGPILGAAGLLWMAHGLAGPSLRGTIPAVVGVALVRQRLLWGELE